MTGPRQRGDERVLALVAGIGLQGRHAELLGHLRAGVDHHGLDRAGGQGPGADGIPVLAAPLGRLADVDRDGDHLDALVLDQPAHGHRRIEASAVGQHHSLSHGQSLPCSSSFSISSLGDAGHVAQTRRHRLAPQLLVDDHQDRVVPGHRADDRVQPAPIERRAYDMGRSGRRAQHHQVARVRHLDHPLPQHPAQVVLGGDLVHREFRQGVRRIAAGQPDLHRAQVLQVARHRGLGRLHALLGQQRHQLSLAGHRLRLQQLGDPVLALVLGQPAALASTSVTIPRSPRPGSPAWPSRGGPPASTPRCASPRGPRPRSPRPGGPAGSAAPPRRARPRRAARRR